MPLRFAVIIPALDEEAALGPTLEELRPHGAAQVIVVDNGSRDRTAEVARQHGAQVVHEPRRGYGSACLAGIAAVDSGVDVIVFMDADGSSNPAELPALLAPIERGEADVAIGSRRLGSAEPGSLTPQQRYGNALATSLLRLLRGVRATDLGPFRAIRRRALDRLGMADPGFGWNIEMHIKAHDTGMRVAEVPVHYRRRRHGKSKISGTLRGTFGAGFKILWTILRHR